MAGVAASGVARSTDGVSIAEPADERELRSLLRTSVMPGAVRVALTREPDFFAGDGLAAADDVTLVARRNGRVVGMGRCSVLQLHRNGAPATIGYLGALRITSGTRESARLLRDGYQLLARHYAGSPVECFFTSIATGNERARHVLEQGGRLGLPTYLPICELVTLVAPIERNTSGVHEEAPALEPELRDFLRRGARDAQLTLTWDDAQWNGLGHHGITASDFAVVRRDGEITAAAAVWNQRGFRQTVIDGYSGALRSFRPLVNSLQALRGLPALPAPGSVLAQGALLGATVNDPDDWPRLWRLVQRRAAAAGLDWITIARDARDPELPVLRRLLHAREYHTTLYEVVWRDGSRPENSWNARYFRPEVSLL